MTIDSETERGIKLMKKILPVEYPPITSYISIAHMLSALWPLKEVIMPWFCQQYIQLASTKRFGHFYDCVYDEMVPFPVKCPFFEVQLLDKRRMHNYPEKFSEFLEFHLLKDCYVVTGVDEYYVNCAWNYQKNHYVHQALFYGCDTKEKKFFLSDFFGDKYTQTEISYEQIDEGDRYTPKELDKWFHEVSIFNYLERHEPYPLNIELMKLFIHDYINSRDSFHKINFSRYREGDHYEYGLQYYDNMAILIANQREHIDIRPFHVLYDHKVAMLIRLEYLYQNSFFDSDTYKGLCFEMNQLKKENFNLRQMVLKYNFRPERVNLDSIIHKCMSLKQKEYDAFSFLLKALS